MIDNRSCMKTQRYMSIRSYVLARRQAPGLRLFSSAVQGRKTGDFLPARTRIDGSWRNVNRRLALGRSWAILASATRPRPTNRANYVLRGSGETWSKWTVLPARHVSNCLTPTPKSSILTERPISASIRGSKK